MERLSIATSDSPMRMVAASKLFYIGDTMLLASKWLFLLGLSTISLAACTTTKVRTYRDPSLIATQINSIAILPFQHTRFGPHIAVSLNRGIVQAVADQNQRVRIIDPAEAQARLGAANLGEVYSQFWRVYSTSGRLNKGALTQIQDALNVDALLHGYVTSIVQLDGAPYRPAFTNLTLTYALIGLRNAIVLWNTTATIRMERTTFDKAPEVEDVIPKAQETIITNLPTLQ
jgi:hypothetical protein